MKRTVAISIILVFAAAGCSSDDGASNTTSTTAVATEPSITITAPPQPDTTAVSLDAGRRHACLVQANGEIFCWGNNSVGQLGNGNFGPNTYAVAPEKVLNIDNAKSVSAGWRHTCAVHHTGEVSCWGDNSRGELGNDEADNDLREAGGAFSREPVKSKGISDAVLVSAGHRHTCALHATGEISCWGSNHDGQLGNGQIGDETDSSIPVKIVGINNAVEISAGGEHTCAVHESGEISCWGDNWRGELGNGEDGTNANSPVPVKVLGITDATSVTSGEWHTCASLASGKAACWGLSISGELGTTSTDVNEVHFPTPQEVENLNDVVSISSEANHTCSVHESGEITCWGANLYGQLGNPAIGLVSPQPVSVTGIDDAVSVTTGSGFTCALREGGKVYCWGVNISGQLGNGDDLGISFNPVKIPGITDATSVATNFINSCATHESGEISCWGRGWRDPLDASNPQPQKISGITDATSVATNPALTCFQQVGGSASCWGLGFNSRTVSTDAGEVSPVPEKWDATPDITQIVPGGTHSCALHTDGTVSCAGANWFGQLANSELRTLDWNPQKIADITDATDIALGVGHTCVAHEAGEVSCWGLNNHGQLGNGHEGFGYNSSVPVRVEGISDAVAVAAGQLALSCALHETGEVSCWGLNFSGELGTNISQDLDHSTVPVRIAGITDAVAISAGTVHVCALLSSGEVHCWGADSLGQLGLPAGPMDDHFATPVMSAGITDAVAISAGSTHTCALHETGEITCWGSNIYGQLGNGAETITSYITTPAQIAGS